MRKQLIIVLVLIVVLAYFLNHFEGCKNEQIAKVEFKQLELPKDRDEKAKVRVSESIKIYCDDKTFHKHKLEFIPLIKSGEQTNFNSLPFGTVVDRFKQPIIVNNSTWISNSQDSNSILSDGENRYLITHFEDIPSSIYQSELKINLGGNIKAGFTTPIDFSPINGVLNTCAGSKTQWNTHLAGEEDYNLNSIRSTPSSPYYVDCSLEENTHNKYCKAKSLMKMYLKGEKFSIYNYGYIVEVGLDKVIRHYVTGKYTPELAIAMDDNKTFYMSDDGANNGLYKFVSDTPITKFESNWSGTLYAAKLTQISDKGAGEFIVDWVKLGQSSDSAIQELIESKITIDDIFYIKDISECPSDFKIVRDSEYLECLKLKKGERAHLGAAFLETRKYASYLGATTEIKKGEGLTYDKDNKSVYFSVSKIKTEGGKDIILEDNRCGAVYALEVDENSNITYMKSLVKGLPLKNTDECAPDTIANPDNILYIGRDLLLIGEDSDFHENNMLWLYNIHTGENTRLATLPVGAEVTGLAVETLGGEDIIFFNVQHPNTEDKKGITGYIKGIPKNTLQLKNGGK